MTPFGLYIILKRRWDEGRRAPHPPSAEPNMRNPSIVPGARVPNGSFGNHLLTPTCFLRIALCVEGGKEVQHM